MSKRLKEVFANMFHVNLLQTLESDPCDINGTLDIIVEEQHVDGGARKHRITRFVKVCHSQEECMHYEIPIDPTTGIGKITISNVQAVQHRIVQINKYDQQMIDGDEINIMYFVDEEQSLEDYADVRFSAENNHQVLRIINRELEQTQVELYKILRDDQQNPITFEPDMEFHVRISDNRCFEEIICLNNANRFHTTVGGLHPGLYTIEECIASAYVVSYRLNFGEETLDTVFDLSVGHNALQIINEEQINTRLTIEKLIRDDHGKLCKPDSSQCFQAHIISDLEDMIIDLNYENDFCVTLYGLEPGYYDISEITDTICDCDYDVSYIVDGGTENCFAHVEINECEHADVTIINTGKDVEICCIDQESPLRICKFIRGNDGCISKPCDNQSFKVMVKGCGLCETFYLNANNNYCVDIANLCNGDYEIQEVSCQDYTTSYIVNDGMERTTACIHMDGCSNYCISIINEERNRGTLNVCKYVRNDFGELTRPNRDQCFELTLSSYFIKETFVLNEENDFCMCFHNLRLGSYEIREELCSNYDYEVSYVVNCGRERSHARVIIDGCCDHEVKVINNTRRSNCGILKICKFEETNSHELVKPCGDEEFEVEVSGPCFNQTYCLRASNNWCVLLEGLEEGEYRICEVSCDDYDVSYIVNREQMEDAYVYMGNVNQEVSIINRRKKSGRLRLRAAIRNCSQDMMKPRENITFEVLIEGYDECFTAFLNATNKWCVILDQIPQGNYRIIQRDNYGYIVRYEINGKEQTFGRVELGREDEDVLIINEVAKCSGSVKVTKYMQDEQGDLSMPSAQDEFHFELKGRSFSKTYKLCSRNDFCVYFDDLEEGTYEICELDKHYEVAYKVDGECRENACFTLGQDDISVDIINHSKTYGVVRIEKRIQRGDKLFMPNRNDFFDVLVKGKNCHEVYELCYDNNFCITLEGLNNQHYEVKELGRNAKCYEINGCMQDDGYFLYEGDHVHVTIINKETKYGCMEIKKMMEDEYGCLVRPNRGESFEIIVESDCFRQKYVLDKENDFCERIYDIPQGHYEIKECDSGYYVSYMINGMPCEKACVDVVDEDVSICVINKEWASGCLQFQGFIEGDDGRQSPNPSDKFYLNVCEEGTSNELTLDCSNDFCNQLCDLQPGSYTITKSGKDNFVFEIDGHTFEDVVCIELNGEHVCVNVIRKKAKYPNITFKKCMVDKHGDMTKPDGKDVFRLILSHHGNQRELELNAKNNWMKILYEQRPGTYEVQEQGGCNVQYQVDDGTPCDNGYFDVTCEDMLITVLNKVEEVGILHLAAKLKDCSGDIIPPTRDMVFYMDVESCDYHECFIFNHKNHWQQKIELCAGTYEITQKPLRQFEDLYYIIDGQKECKAMIQLGCEDVYAQSVNVMKSAGGSIEISKFKRDDTCGCLRKPIGEEEYEIEIHGEDYHQIVILNSYNKWRERIDSLTKGMYHIKEIGGSATTTYIVNGAKECTEAIVDVCEDTSTVKIINEEVKENKGSIELCKLLKDDEGCYCYPSEHDSYWMKIKGESGTSRVLLNFANHFYASIRNLTDGWYEVIEESETSGVKYVVNNAAPANRGLVHVMQNANTVNVINPSNVCGGSIQLCKYVQTREGLLVKPMNGSKYHIHVSKPGFNEVYTLSDENDFCCTLQNLEDGTYVVDEVDHDHVTYIINGGTQVDHAVVVVKGNANTVQIINAEEPMQKGSIALAKYVRKNNQLVRPSGKESYVFHVSKPNFNQFYTLDRSNQWMMTITDLEDGDYVINETTTQDHVSYIINGGNESDYGVVSVRSNSNTVQIINTPMKLKGSIQLDKYMRDANQQLVRPNPGFVTRIHVSMPGYNQVFTLNQANNWSMLIGNLANGFYAVDEVDSEDEVTYIVNNGTEVANAIVSVMDNANTVQIIDTPSNPYGSIQLDKFVRNMQGQLVRPAPDFSTRVHVSKPGYNQFFTLNQANNWSYKIDQLMAGQYVVDEVDSPDEVTYIVDNGNEVANAVVNVMNNRNTVQIINTPRSTTGSIQLDKYIRNADDQLVRPSSAFTTRVYVSKPEYYQVFTLNQANNWSMLVTDLANGLYTVDEIDSLDEVSYIVNDGSEVDNAVVSVMNNANSVKIINTPMSSAGSIQIDKYMRNANNQLVRPESGFMARIHVSKPGYNEVFNLTSANNWSLLIDNLEEGYYVIDEVEAQDEVTYIINDGSEVKNGIVFVDKNANSVKVINTPTSPNASLSISKFLRNDQGQLVLPNEAQSFQVDVSGPNYQNRITLNRTNRWNVLLKDLENGMYQVKEVMNQGYQVSYIVDNGMESAYANVMINTDMHTVSIINSAASALGRLEIAKYIKNADGTLIRPVEGDQFMIEIYNDDILRNEVLDFNNQFTLMIDDLANGTYNIREIDEADMYITTFKVNGGAESESATVQMNLGTINKVDILNELRVNENSIEVFKYMLDEAGNYLPPTPGDTYRFMITGAGIQKVYDLTQENQWHQSLKTLPTGEYQVQEVGSPYRVKYLVNSAQLLDEAKFTALPGTTSIVGIINLLNNVENGTMNLQKRMRDDNGELIIPSNGESFNLHITSPTFDQMVALDRDNDYSYTLSNLPYGTYNIVETTAGYDVSYQINGGAEQNFGRLDIQNGAPNDVLVINAQTSVFFNMRQNSKVQFVIE